MNCPVGYRWLNCPQDWLSTWPKRWRFCWPCHFSSQPHCTCPCDQCYHHELHSIGSTFLWECLTLLGLRWWQHTSSQWHQMRGPLGQVRMALPVCQWRWWWRGSASKQCNWIKKGPEKETSKETRTKKTEWCLWSSHQGKESGPNKVRPSLPTFTPGHLQGWKCMRSSNADQDYTDNYNSQTKPADICSVGQGNIYLQLSIIKCPFSRRPSCVAPPNSLTKYAVAWLPMAVQDCNWLLQINTHRENMHKDCLVSKQME